MARVVHFEIMATDGEAAKRFYASLFGWKINSENPMSYGLVEAEEGGIGGGITGGDHNAATFYIAVDDLEGTLRKAESLGGSVIVPVTVVPNMVTFAQFADPFGNVIGLVSNEGP